MPNHIHYSPALVLDLVSASVSLLCSVITLWLIYVMGKWNPYLQIIVCLSICQAIYDISLIMVVNPSTINAYLVLRGAFGLATTFWTNIIAFIIYYVVKMLAGFNLKRYFYLVLAIVMIPSIVVGVVQVYFTGILGLVAEEFYYYVRIASIAFNLIVYGLVRYEVYRRKQLRPPNMRATRDAVEELVYRLQYYPIVQIICRVFAAWKEESCGFYYDDEASSSTACTAALYLASITQPAAGIGFFIIFLVVSPGAWEHLVHYTGGMVCSTKIKSSKFQVAANSSINDSENNTVSNNPFQNSACSNPSNGNVALAGPLSITSDPEEFYREGSLGSLSTSQEKDWRLFDEYELTQEISRIYHPAPGSDGANSNTSPFHASEFGISHRTSRT